MEISELLEQGITDSEGIGRLGRLGAQLVLQKGIEEEVAAFLQRVRYERTMQARGSRNGNRPKLVLTAEGALEIQMPQLRNTAVKFVSRVIPDVGMAIRTRPLEVLIIGAYVRGLSDRDIESLLEEAGMGKVSRTTASRICQELRDRYRAFRARSLLEIKLLVLFLDAIYLPTRPSGAKEGVLVAWGYTRSGERVLLDVCLGQRERHEDWLEMGRGLTRRGLRAPWMAVVDGAPGLIKAVEELWPDSDRQRCTVHRLRNVLAKLPKNQQLHNRVRNAYWAALDQAGAAADGEARLRALVGELEADYPSAAACLAEDLPALCAHLRYPLRLRKRLRSTNLLERSLGEVKRRTKVIGRFPGETSCLTLVWAVLDLYITHATNGIKFTQLERQSLKRTRYEGHEPTIPEEVTAA